MESQLQPRLPPKLLPPDWLPTCTHPILNDHGLQVHLQTLSITASKCSFKLVQSLPACAFLNSHICGLQVLTITAYNCISNPLNYSLQLHI